MFYYGPMIKIKKQNYNREEFGCHICKKKKPSNTSYCEQCGTKLSTFKIQQPINHDEVYTTLKHWNMEGLFILEVSERESDFIFIGCEQSGHFTQDIEFCHAPDDVDREIKNFMYEYEEDLEWLKKQFGTANVSVRYLFFQTLNNEIGESK